MGTILITLRKNLEFRFEFFFQNIIFTVIEVKNRPHVSQTRVRRVPCYYL